MILVTVSKEKDGSFLVNRWKKDIVVNHLTKKCNLIKTHHATIQLGAEISMGQIEMFRHSPPENLRIT